MISFDELGNKGWIGNTMFQYAALRGIAAHRGYDFVVPPNDQSRTCNYLLHDVFELSSVKYNGYMGGLYRHKTSDDMCHSTTFHFNQEFYDECPDNVNISGFYQSEKWFKNIENSIRKDFNFKDYILEPCQEMISSFDVTPIFLHVRRGDYVKRPEYHFNLDITYFKKALSLFSNEPVLVFSDDIEWCRDQQLFQSDRFHFSETEDRLPMSSFVSNQGYKEGALTPEFDLCLMTLCDGAIISNSSYSWWGAWLQSRTRKVVCPDVNKWAGPKNTVDYRDIIVNGWEDI